LDETLNSIGHPTDYDGILNAFHMRLHLATHVPTLLVVANFVSTFGLYPLGGAAAVQGIAAVAAGESASIASYYRTALPRWFGAVVWFLVSILLVIAAAAIVVGAATLIPALALHALRTSDPLHVSNLVRVLVLVSLLVVFALATSFSAVVTTFGVAGFGAAVLGERGLRGSLRFSWEKALRRSEIVNTLVLGLATLIILVIVGFGSNYVGAVIFGLTGSDLLNYAFRWIFDLIVYGFLAAFCYVYYSSGSTPQTSAGS
jgi:hypothetical protein